MLGAECWRPEPSAFSIQHSFIFSACKFLTSPAAHSRPQRWWPLLRVSVEKALPSPRTRSRRRVCCLTQHDLAASTKTTNGAYYRDLVVGTGATVATGQTIAVRYTGWLANGTQFDSNTALANPLTFKVGSGQVIAGFDEAIVGAAVGTQRQILIPPSLGYGPYDYGPIPGNSVLVFKVEVISVQ